ncbi:MAG: glycosyltransferase [Anaerolineaceae bacterium]|nr:glycosyltransferase [Anaerolineaceae bacterium]
MRVLIMMSRTGGGHVAAAEALTEALEARFGSECQVTQLDVFTEYMRYPFNRQPQIYAHWIRNAAWLYGLYFSWWNLPLLHRLGAHLLYQPNRSWLRKLFREQPADLYVSVHAAISGPVLLAAPRGPQRPAFLAVGVDLISAHRTWFDQGLDACVMPTRQAYECGLRYGMQPPQLRHIGLPIRPSFVNALTDRATARTRLGWPQEGHLVLLVSGDGGFGPVYRTVRALDEAELGCQLAVVTGRNRALERKLRAQRWRGPTHICGFVDDMALRMSAADILISKAGSLTIGEACVAGLPMILTRSIPGQERGNTAYIEAAGAGLRSRDVSRTVAIVKEWLADPAGLQQRAERARALSTPDATHEIAQLIGELLREPVHESAIDPTHDPSVGHKASTAAASIEAQLDRGSSV